ncbi:Piso0_005028 [Millerozyma farinosa CBS 7064]|uniref:Probable electron transfer flavoprotein subunit alpha n=1 Tax=Pichia sorbitophila (strain ATCC MYA-4447 / BCRC 22081 / CBS 7064 / NBRC 10061 / NRRL Y-12695) TaxID=559304 RepID=G8Y414_PICSO|nr:Piso0_005028 [Millerozyma farinosa CBS 7064]
MRRFVRSVRHFGSSTFRLDSLVFIEGSAGKVNTASLSAVTAAAQIGKPITALVAGPEGEAIASEVGKINGIDKVLLAKGENYLHYLGEELSPLIKDVLQDSKFTHFITAATSVGKSVLPRVGALVDVQPISDLIKVESENTFLRPIYAGNALATVRSNEKLILASVRASAFAPTPVEGGSSSIEEFTPKSKAETSSEFVSENLITSERPELGSAKRVVSGGRGLKNKETFEKIIEPLAAKLNAAIGASRVAVDSGFCDNSLQVGQTGKVVAPELYFAVGISGAIQHLAGMKDAKTIVAINKDPEAPIFNIADIGLVADINEAVPELVEKL